jgi:hypothetical protein
MPSLLLTETGFSARMPFIRAENSVGARERAKACGGIQDTVNS